MRFDLAAEAQRERTTRKRTTRKRGYVTLPPVSAPAMLATDLYRSVYAPIIAVWTEAAKAINAEYARTLAQMVTDSPSDVQRQIDGGAAAANQLTLALTPSLRDWTLRVERYVRQRWTRQVYSATSVDLSTRLSAYDASDTLESYLSWNVDLVRDVSEQIKKRIADAVFLGLTQRQPARDVAKAISDAVGMGRARAKRIASDQLNKLSATLADERRLQAGIETWSWVHSGKAHPRKHHQARDGNIYSDDPKQVGGQVGGKPILTPPPRDDRPGQAPYCGCRSRSVIIWEDDE